MNAQEVVDYLQRKYGGNAWCNGIGSILYHKTLGDTFTIKDWDDWQFKPSEMAFERAERLGLIQQILVEGVSSDVWQMTELGKETAILIQQLVDG